LQKEVLYYSAIPHVMDHWPTETRPGTPLT
jgi:hypothetical protein